MLDKKFSTHSLIDLLLICLLSLTYAGISSGIFFGVRVVDILILLGLIYKSRVKININLWLMLGLWFISTTASTVVGFYFKEPYIISDLRFFSTFGLGVLLAYSLAKNTDVNIEYAYYIIIVSTLLMYLIIPYFDSIRFYYIPESFQKEEHANTIFGPSTVLLNYLFIYLVFKKKNLPFIFYAAYIVTTILIYKLRISRQDLVIMSGLFVWSIGYRLIHNIKITYLLLSIAVGLIASLYVFQASNKRTQGIVNPTADTSFNYRVISNNDFLKQFNRSPTIKKALGFGMGSTFIFHYNEHLGRRELNILDNTPLTILMKTGYMGLTLYFLILLYPMLYLNWHQRIVLIFPIILSMLLFNHALYNVLYIIGIYYVSFRLMHENNKLLESSNQ